jgi:hypothetical protein
MKKLALIVASLTLAATPVFACPHEDKAEARTAEKSKEQPKAKEADKTEKTAKPAEKTAKPAEKKAEKVSSK